MFRKNTVFVVGAGASCEVDMPSGADLKGQIASSLRFGFDATGLRLNSKDLQIVQALRVHLRDQAQGQDDIQPYVDAARHIAEAMPAAASIDTFLDSHPGNERIELCAKLAIVQSILQREKSSRLFVEYRDSNARLDLGKIEGTWFAPMWQLLHQGCPKEKIDQLFNNVSFITFNYDRCIEHVFFQLLQIYYDLPVKEATELLRDKLEIYHPYGVTGALPWQSESEFTFYGGDPGRQLLPLAAQIKTFTERVEDLETLEAIRERVQDARAVVFLGFGFHEQNMRLIKPNGFSTARFAFATAYSMSDEDRTMLDGEIAELLNANNRPMVRINNCECRNLFGENWRRLSRL